MNAVINYGVIVDAMQQKIINLHLRVIYEKDSTWESQWTKKAFKHGRRSSGIFEMMCYNWAC